MAINYPQWLAFAKYSYQLLKWALIEKPNARDAAANLTAHEYDLLPPDVTLPAGGYGLCSFLKPICRPYHSFDCACFFSFRSSIWLTISSSTATAAKASHTQKPANEQKRKMTPMTAVIKNTKNQGFCSCL